MPYDPTIALRAVQPQIDFGGAVQNAMAFRNAQQVNQLNQLKLAQEQQAMQQEAGLRNYLAQSPDLSAPETQRQLIGQYGAAGMDVVNKELQRRQFQSAIDKAGRENVSEALGTVRDMYAGVLARHADNLNSEEALKDYLEVSRTAHNNPFLGEALKTTGASLANTFTKGQTALESGTLGNLIQTSAMSADQLRQSLTPQEPKLGTYQPGDYTTASWAKFTITKNPADLVAKKTAAEIAATTEKPLTPAQQQKLKSAKAEDVDKYNSISQTATDLANLRDQLIGNPATGKAEHPGLGAITGWSALLPLEKIPESDASAASTILETIKGKVNALGRQIASVHGKLGNMAVQEWKILADSVQKIDPKAKNFADQINNIVTTAEDLQRNSRGRFQYEYDEDVPNIAPPAADGKAQLSPQDQAALDWANKNPKDPRAAQIKAKLGVK